jgi:hypothetical protein
VRVLEHLALVGVLGGRAQLAARLLGYGVAFYAKGTASREFTEISTYDRLTSELSRQLPSEEVAHLMAEGALWNEDRAVEMAMTDL